MSTVNTKINNYMDDVCSLVKNKKVHKEIKLELQCHIQDLIDEYISCGMTEEESVNKALLEMGPPHIVGEDLNKVHKANSDWMLIIFTTSIVLFGLYTLWFLQNSVSDNVNFAEKSIIYLLISIFMSLIFIKIDFRNIKKYSKHIYIFSIALMVFTLFTSPVINGTKSFISIGGFSLRIPDIALFLLIISLAGIFDSYNWNNKKSLFKGIVLVFAPCLLFLLFPSIASLALYFIAAFSIMLLSGFKFRYMLAASGALAIILFGSVFYAHYRINRILAFLKPTSDPEGSTYVYNQILNLKNSASIIGKQNGAALSSLPEAHTDFVLTSIIYSFGWLVAIILSIVIAAFIVRIIFIGAKTRSSYGKLLISGICALFASQFIFCILSALLLIPSLGFNMPFISYGGTSLLINILAVSLINNIYKNRNIPYGLSV